MAHQVMAVITKVAKRLSGEPTLSMFWCNPLMMTVCNECLGVGDHVEPHYVVAVHHVRKLPDVQVLSFHFVVKPYFVTKVS